jgi:histidyl-tRNA synthetase
MTRPLTQPAKGTRDFLPAELRRREHVARVIREVYARHGFEPLETPTFERLETLLGKYGDEGDQLVFKILHRGQPLVDGIRSAHAHLQEPGAIVVGRSGEVARGAETLLADLGLRYDLTVPLARVYAEHAGKLPPVFKRYQIQPVWRADTPGKGRFREFYQCDVDVCGSTSRVVEAEVTSAVATALRTLGFTDFQIRINHRALLRALIEVAGLPVEKEGEAIVAVDKLDKIGADGVEKELAQKGVSAEQARALLALVAPLDARAGADALDAFAARLGDHPAGQAALADLREIFALAAHGPAATHLTFDPGLARGLGYYTGAIFEIAVKDLAGSLGGGGRYDELIGMFLGKPVPACGFSIGFERILVVMEERKMFPAHLASVDVRLAATDDAHLGAAFALASTLRAAGISVELQPKAEKNVPRLRKLADESGARAAVWLGGEDATPRVWLRETPEVREQVLGVEALVARLGPRG